MLRTTTVRRRDDEPRRDDTPGERARSLQTASVDGAAHVFHVPNPLVPDRAASLALRCRSSQYYDVSIFRKRCTVRTFSCMHSSIVLTYIGYRIGTGLSNSYDLVAENTRDTVSISRSK